MAQHQEVRLQQVVEPRLFEIADYQRVYAWEVKHLSDLWEDLDLVGPGAAITRGLWSSGRCRTAPVQRSA